MSKLPPFLRQGLEHHRAGRLAEAEACYQQALRQNPEDPETQNLLGVALFQQGRGNEALAFSNSAARLRPESVSIRVNAGHVCCATRHYREALDHYRAALKLGNAGDELLNNLGMCLRECGHLDEAIGIYHRLLESNPQHAEGWNNLAAVHLTAGRAGEAERCVRKALAIRPDFAKAEQNLSRVLAAMVPLWHFPMMNDDPRNSAFERAIDHVVRPASLVLDIGTGSGLLAMMAARAGAVRVIGCEMAPGMAAVARQIVAANGFGDRIEVLEAKSTSLNPEDLGERKPDVLIAEVFDSAFFGEEALDTLEDARRRLLAPDASMIPWGGRILGALFESEELTGAGSVGQVRGFDLSAFNALRPESFQRALRDYDHRLLCEPFEIFSFDFRGDLPLADDRQIKVAASTGGQVHGIVYWFELFLDEQTVYGTSPLDQDSHWDQQIWLRIPPLQIAKGAAVSIAAQHNRRRLTLRVVTPS